MLYCANYRKNDIDARKCCYLLHAFFASWGISSNGRARALHARGSGIGARILHKKLFP